MTEAELRALDVAVDYLSVTLELTESVVPEEKKLVLTPAWGKDYIEFNFDEGDDQGEMFVRLNRQQIECLVDFLSAWLKRRDGSVA